MSIFDPSLSRSLPLALCVALASMASACGDESEPGDVQRVDGEPDALIEPDAQPDDQPEPEPLVLVPSFVEVSASPLRHVYAPGLLLLPEARVFDQFGRPLEAEVGFEVEPEGAAELQENGRWRLDQEGSVALVGCTGQGGDVAEVCGRFELIVDRGGPSITVTSPLGGAQLLASEHPEGVVEVEGTVADSSGALHLFVNGQRVDLDEAGGFTTQVSPRFGINHVEIIATDGLQAVEATSGVDFIWAEAYHAANDAGEQATVHFDDGMEVRIGRTFFDDGEPLERDPEATEVQTVDLAGILELLLQEIDIMSQIPNPITDSDTLSLSITQVRMDNTRIDVRVTDTGLELYIQLVGVRVGTSGRFSLEGTTLDLTGGITATASALATMTLSKAGLGAPYEVELDRVELALEQAESQFGSGEANAIFDLAESALRGVLEQTLLGAIEGAFIEDLPGTLRGVFDSLEGALNGLSFPLETGLGPAVQIDLAAQISTLTPEAGSHVEAVLDTRVSTNAAPLFAGSRGVALSRSLEEETPFFRGSALQIGLRLGLFYGLLHTVWDAGVLEIDVFDVLPAEIGFLLDAATVSARLPPMVTEPLPFESEGNLMVTLGQLEMVAEFGDQQDIYAFNIQVGAEISVADAAIALTLQSEPTITAWVVSTSGDAPQFDAATLRELLLTQLWPRLEGLFSESLSFPLPTVDLGSLGALAPSLSDMIVEIDLSRPLDVRGDHVIFDGVWRGTATF